jgi:large subunit ribosomal protein L25
MDQVTLSAEPRVETGSRPARRMRRKGLVPAVVYGRGMDAVQVAVDGRDLYRALHTESGANALIEVEVDGGETVLAVAREIQRHPVRNEITHLDFIKVSLDVEIEAEVSIEYVGTPTAVIEEGGIVETIENSVLIEALPTAIPNSIALDISEMVIGDTMQIADLPVIDGVTYVDDAERPLVTVLAPRIEEPEEPEVELDEHGEPILVDEAEEEAEDSGEDQEDDSA